MSLNGGAARPERRDRGACRPAALRKVSVANVIPPGRNREAAAAIFVGFRLSGHVLVFGKLERHIGQGI